MPESPRLIFENQGGMSTVMAPDLLKPGQFCYLQNIRKLLGGRMSARPPMGANLLGGTLPAGATSVVRMNDPYMAPPGYVLVVGAAGIMYVDAAAVASGLSGGPLSFLIYQPPSSPQPWCPVTWSSRSGTRRGRGSTRCSGGGRAGST